MKIFVLEDDPNRIKWFEKKFKGEDLVVTTEVDHAKLKFANHTFDVVFLDHDLGGKVFVNSNDENTGYQLAKWLKKMDMHFKQIFIHSMNPAGAENIYQVVKGLAPEVRKVPFLMLMVGMR